MAGRDCQLISRQPSNSADAQTNPCNRNTLEMMPGMLLCRACLLVASLRQDVDAVTISNRKRSIRISDVV